MRTAGVATAAAGVANTDGVAGVLRRSALCVRGGRSALPARCITFPVECARPHRRNRLFVALVLLPLLLSTSPPP